MKEFLVINSQKDAAGTNIFQRIMENYQFRKTKILFASNPVYSYENVLLASSTEEIIFVGSELDKCFESRASHYIFISKHRAESQIPSLTAHFTGNFASNDFGGNPKEISKYAPSMLKQYLRALDSIKGEIPEGYNLTLEATHHGPTSLERPSMFVELGSGPDQWKDEKAALCVAKALMKSIKSNEHYDRCAIGLGGTHYPAKFNEVILKSEIALGAIVPKYALDSVDEQMLSQIIQKSEEKITMAVLDNKGMGKNKNRILDLLSSFGLEILKI